MIIFLELYIRFAMVGLFAVGGGLATLPFLTSMGETTGWFTSMDISNMVAASAVTATLTTVFMGALSDKIGKRKLFICAGYILWGVSVFCFAFLLNYNFF